ncbi:MAG: hypothetical protein CME67_02895 [Halobacteriovoraceae bacterium]|nr:hypothetical protein [Halobacteriovoraceae bacterium]
MRNIAMASLILLTTGCWVGNLFVKNLDTLISVRVSSTLDLYYKQKQQLDQDIDSFLESKKHIANEINQKLSSYQKLLGTGKINQSQIEKEMLFWQDFYKDMMLEIIDKYSSYLVGLTTKQQKHFFENYNERTEELLERLNEDQVEPQEEKYERFFGELNKKMLSILKSNENFFKSRLKAYIERRQILKEELLKLFKSKADDKQFKKLLSSYTNQRFKKDVTHQHSLIIKKLLDLMDNDQKSSLNENLAKFKSWVDVFERTEY